MTPLSRRQPLEEELALDEELEEVPPPAPPLLDVELVDEDPLGVAPPLLTPELELPVAATLLSAHSQRLADKPSFAQVA